MREKSMLHGLVLSLILFVSLAGCFSLYAQDASEKYTPPGNSPFRKDSRSPTLSDADQRNRFLIGIPATSILKGEACIAGTWVGRDLSAKLRMGAPFMLNRCDFGRFWDANLNMADELDDGRIDLKREQQLLTKKLSGLSTGAGIRFLSDSDDEGFSFIELEYSLVTNKSEIDSKHLTSSSDPSYKSTRQDFCLNFGKTYLLGNGDHIKPFIEESLGIGVGHYKVTRVNSTDIYDIYKTDGTKFSCYFPLFVIQLSIGISLTGK